MADGGSAPRRCTTTRQPIEHARAADGGGGRRALATLRVWSSSRPLRRPLGLLACGDMAGQRAEFERLGTAMPRRRAATITLAGGTHRQTRRRKRRLHLRHGDDCRSGIRWRPAAPWPRPARPPRNAQGCRRHREATTGSRVAPQTARRRSRRRSRARVPSRSMLVSRISPAPRAANCRHQSTASRPVRVRPPWVNTSHRPGPAARASTATTTHWLPNFSAPSRTSVRAGNGGAVHAALVGARQQQAAHVLRAAHAAADRQRQEDARGGAGDDIQDRVPVLMAGGDVQEGQLVRARGVVDRGLLDRVAGIAQGDEVDALHHPSVLHVQAGNDSQLEHGSVKRAPTPGCKCEGPMAVLRRAGGRGGHVLDPPGRLGGTCSAGSPGQARAAPCHPRAPSSAEGMQPGPVRIGRKGRLRSRPQRPCRVQWRAITGQPRRSRSTVPNDTPMAPNIFG